MKQCPEPLQQKATNRNGVDMVQNISQILDILRDENLSAKSKNAPDNTPIWEIATQRKPSQNTPIPALADNYLNDETQTQTLTTSSYRHLPARHYDFYRKTCGNVSIAPNETHRISRDTINFKTRGPGLMMFYCS